MRFLLTPLTFTLLFCTLDSPAADDKPEPTTLIKHQITGLFLRDREADLRETFQAIPEIKLVRIDFPNAEASFDYDPAKVFPGANSDQVVERFDNLLRNASRHTFGIKPLCVLPREKLQLIEIPVIGLDCKACCLAAYEAIYKLEGVEHATASFKDGLVTARVHPEKTNLAALEDALKKKNVSLLPAS